MRPRLWPLGLLFVGCAPSPDPTAAAPPRAPWKLQQVLVEQKTRFRELPAETWKTVYQREVQVQAGDLLDLRATTQASSEDAHTAFSARLLVDGKVVGPGCRVSCCQPEIVSGNHHTPLGLVGTWVAPQSKRARVEVQVWAQRIQKEQDENVIDDLPQSKFGHLSIAHFSGQGLGLQQVVSTPQLLEPGQPSGWQKTCAENGSAVFRLELPKADWTYLFGSANVRQLSDSEAGHYRRKFPEFRGEQVSSTWWLGEQKISSDHGENVTPRNVILTSQNEAWVPGLQGQAEFRLCGAYRRLAKFNREELLAHALLFGAGGGALLSNQELWQLPDQLEVPQGQRLRLSALFQFENPTPRSQEILFRLQVGPQAWVNRRSLGARYRYGWARFEGVLESGRYPLQLLVEPALKPTSTYLLLQRFERPSASFQP